MFNKSVFDFSWNCITASASVKRRDQRFRCRSSVSLTHHTEILQERAVCLWSNIRWQKPLLPLLWANEPVKPTQRWCAVDAYEFYLELKKNKIMWVRKELWWWCKWYGALVRGSCTNQCGTRTAVLSLERKRAIKHDTESWSLVALRRTSDFITAQFEKVLE